jgi:hypothetical protein
MSGTGDYPEVREHREARGEREGLPEPIGDAMTALRDSLHQRWPTDARAVDDLISGRRLWIWQTQWGDSFAAAWERYAEGEILIWMYGSAPGFRERLRRRSA